MRTSTIACATERLSLGAPAGPSPPRTSVGPYRCYRGPVAAGSFRAGLSSPAGLHRRPWLARLRRALAEDLFVLHFQPIVSLPDGRTRFCEALLRLADEGGGRLVGPASFLPAAERYGLIRDIDRMVLEKVAAMLAARPGGPSPSVAVNLSALSVTDEGMLAHIERTLAGNGLDPSRLVIELTETASISDMERARAFCEGTHRLGCSIALDDFGAGFGSLQYLKHLPFRFLKIDGDFIRSLPTSPKDQLLVKAIAGVVKGMGARTIAEFVGDTATMGLLASYGVDYAQGFAVGRPRAAMPAGA